MRKTYDMMTEAEKQELYRSFIQAKKRGLVTHAPRALKAVPVSR